MLHAYKDNTAMRAQYFKINSITHAFSWKNGERNYQLYLGDADSIGFPHGTFSTMRALKDFVTEYAPELKGTFYRGNH